ncbi:MAG: pantoate--beta-alanine ligase [Nitrospiraceae bacterium]
MNILRRPSAMTAWSRALRREGVTIGFVPTMGALHEGHRALIRAARLTCDAVVVSIFVNPTQFGPKEDLSRYPRPFAKDVRLCRAEGVDAVYAPTVAAIYPEGFQTAIHLPQLAARWEGAIRPHHFSGVATVVTKLLATVQPDRAIFGQKDFQQCAVVRQLVADLNLPCRIDVHPTVREADGLALSSRNVYLSASARAQAPVLARALRQGATLVRAGGKSVGAIHKAMTRICKTEPGVTVDYLALCNPATLEPLTRLALPAVLLGAIRLDGVRLIDNLLVTTRGVR